MDEIDLFCNHKVEDIAVLDPTFNSGSQYKAVLMRFIAHGFIGRLSLQCRFEMADTVFLDLCGKLNVRLEFGLQTIHKKELLAINRPNNMTKVTNILNELNARKTNYEVSIIFGLPHQTLGSFKETVDFCLQNKVPVLKAFPLMLLRGTEMHRNKDLYKFVESGDVIPAVISSSTFTKRDWEEMEEISLVLRKTEGNHPSTIQEVERYFHSNNDFVKNDGIFNTTTSLWSPQI